MDNTDKVKRQMSDHRESVEKILNLVADILVIRACHHDDSKLEEPEWSVFLEYTPKLWDSTFGSPEYMGYLKEMKVALDHHYHVNRHHPQAFDNGINGMTLIDLMEMLADWMAAVKRHKDGDIIKSIDINVPRFGISTQLQEILVNTVNLLEFNRNAINKAKEIVKEATG